MKNYYGFENNKQHLAVMNAVRSIIGLDPWDFYVYYHNDGEFEGCIEIVLNRNTHIVFYNYVLEIKCTTSFNMKTVELITKISDNIGTIWEAYRMA